MVSGVTNLLSTAKRYGGYGANFILGTGSNTIGEHVQNAVKNRKTTGASFGQSVFDGFSRGVKASNAEVAQTGFWTGIRKSFTSMPHNMAEGWRNANVADKKGISKYLSKLGGSLKPIGKVMPFAFNVLALLSSVPSIMERVQDEGVFGGIKEAGKAVGKMGMYALGSALGAAFGGIGAFAGAAVAGMLTDVVFGKDYTVAKDEKVAKQQEVLEKMQQNPYNANQNVGLNYTA